MASSPFIRTCICYIYMLHYNRDVVSTTLILYMKLLNKDRLKIFSRALEMHFHKIHRIFRKRIDRKIDNVKLEVVEIFLYKKNHSSAKTDSDWNFQRWLTYDLRPILHTFTAYDSRVRDLYEHRQSEKWQLFNSSPNEIYDDKIYR